MGLLFTAISSSFAQIPRDTTPIRPTIPSADRDNTSRVFLEHANELFTEPYGKYQILVGDVQFRRGPMFMWCDSAHFYDSTGSFDAYGNVRMQQGDTLFVYANSLHYDDPERTATLFAGENTNVKLINRDVTLTTEKFIYDLAAELGFYEVGGTLTDKQNKLTSTEGEYSPATKEAVFRDNVHLVSLSEKDTLDITTDFLYYNTESHVAEMTTYTTIRSGDGTIYTSNGLYNTETTQSDLFERSLVVANNGNTLIGDTIFYNRRNGFGEVFGNMQLTDTTNKVMLRGNYGFYNELTDSAFVTGRALGLEYSTADTLYVHGDSIRAFRKIIPTKKDETTSQDTIRFLVANPRVKFYRSDIQGLCDSLTFTSRDTMIYMDRFPVVWNTNRQITGVAIDIHLNDSTVDRAYIPKDGFMAEMIEEGYFNQLSGKEMTAYFADKTIRHLDVEGNVVAIMFPEENDSTINKVINLESSFLSADFKDQTIEKMKLWPQTNATATPLYLAKKSIFFQPKFQWLEKYRPTDPEDVFNFSEDLIERFAIAEVYDRPVQTEPIPEDIDSSETTDDIDIPENPEDVDPTETPKDIGSPENPDGSEIADNADNNEYLDNSDKFEIHDNETPQPSTDSESQQLDVISQ